METKQRQPIQTIAEKPLLTTFVNIDGEEQKTVRLMGEDTEAFLDSKIAAVKELIQNNPATSLPETDINALYSTGQNLYKEFITTFRDCKINCYLTQSQHTWLTDKINKHIEYTVDTVFLAIELTELMGMMGKKESFKDEKEVRCFVLSPTELTYVYHLISKETVKGLNKSTYTFANILQRIGELSKIINFYDNCGKDISTDIQNWIGMFGEANTSAGQVLKPAAEVFIN
jgi:hypothetical protein